MSLGIRYWLLAIGLAATIVRPLMAEITAEQVRESIERAADYLKSRQNRATGSWPEYDSQPGGLTALCTLALINAGVGVSDPAVQQALTYLESVGLPKKTYSCSLQTMVFCAAAPEKRQMLIRRNVKWLESIQITSGVRKGAWPYSSESGANPVWGDNSNTQFALLALHEAERAGVEVSDPTWRLALAHWLEDQRPDGCWTYIDNKDQPGTGSMTCAGIASVVIASGQIHERDAQVKDDKVLCCVPQKQDDTVERGLEWLGERFSVYENPIDISGVGSNIRRRYLHYYLYCLERVGRLTGRRFVGRHDWYREGADMLVNSQDKLTGYWRGVGPTEDNPLIATSFALLFLSKGRRPVVIGKLKHRADNDWDLHRSAVRNLTKRVERQWRRDLTWQVIDAKAATVEDLFQAPVLFISGRQSLNMTREQKENLRAYVLAGGFLFAEACCNGQAFDRTFRKLMQELFPESPLRLLPATHAIWYAEAKVDPKYMRPLYGINTCCRTSVVYCPQDLSCFWELSDERKGSDYPQAVQDEIEACLRIGANVIAYATNRVLKEKLDRPQLARSDGAGEQPARGVLQVPQLIHSGGGDDAPNALPNLLDVFRRELQQRVSTAPILLTADDESIYRYPILFMHGRRDFRFTASQRKALSAYLEQGGFIFADAICASPEFALAVRRELEAAFPDKTLARIPTTHPLFTQQYGGYDLGRVTLRDPQFRAERERLEARLSKTTPLLEGLEIDGRLAFVFSPNDISCALENSESLECKGYVRADAAKIGVNVILFALQQ